MLIVNLIIKLMTCLNYLGSDSNLMSFNKCNIEAKQQREILSRPESDFGAFGYSDAPAMTGLTFCLCFNYFEICKRKDS